MEQVRTIAAIAVDDIPDSMEQLKGFPGIEIGGKNANGVPGNVMNFANTLRKAKLPNGGAFAFDKEGLLVVCPHCGFRARICYDKVTRGVYVHIIGTRWGEVSAPAANMKNIWGETTHDAYSVGMDVAKAMKNSLGKKGILSGHSLGGSIAQLACAKYGVETVVLNSAPVNKKVLQKIIDNGGDSKHRESCLQISVKGDFASDSDNVLFRRLFANCEQFSGKVLYLDKSNADDESKSKIFSFIKTATLTVCKKISDMSHTVLTGSFGEHVNSMISGARSLSGGLTNHSAKVVKEAVEWADKHIA
jgi:hypothetical protein